MNNRGFIRNSVSVLSVIFLSMLMDLPTSHRYGTAQAQSKPEYIYMSQGGGISKIVLHQSGDYEQESVSLPYPADNRGLAGIPNSSKLIYFGCRDLGQDDAGNSMCRAGLYLLLHDTQTNQSKVLVAPSSQNYQPGLIHTTIPIDSTMDWLNSAAWLFSVSQNGQFVAVDVGTYCGTRGMYILDLQKNRFVASISYTYFAWAPDGRSFVFIGNEPSARFPKNIGSCTEGGTLYRYDLQTSKLSTLLKGSNNFLFHYPHVLPDGQIQYLKEDIPRSANPQQDFKNVYETSHRFTRWQLKVGTPLKQILTPMTLCPNVMNYFNLNATQSLFHYKGRTWVPKQWTPVKKDGGQDPSVSYAISPSKKWNVISYSDYQDESRKGLYVSQNQPCGSQTPTLIEAGGDIAWWM